MNTATTKVQELEASQMRVVPVNRVVPALDSASTVAVTVGYVPVLSTGGEMADAERRSELRGWANVVHFEGDEPLRFGRPAVDPGSNTPACGATKFAVHHPTPTSEIWYPAAVPAAVRVTVSVMASPSVRSWVGVTAMVKYGEVAAWATGVAPGSPPRTARLATRDREPASGPTFHRMGWRRALRRAPVVLGVHDVCRFPFMDGSVPRRIHPTDTLQILRFTQRSPSVQIPDKLRPGHSRSRTRSLGYCVC